MTAVDVVLPMFGLILCGYGAVLLRIMGAEGVKGAILAGFAAQWSGLHPPKALDALLALLTNAAAPASLLALGATLAGFHIGKAIGETSFLIVMKLLVHPLLVWLLVTRVFALAPIQVAVATILAALPAGNNGFILAQRCGVHLERTASTVLITTVISVFTPALLVAYFAGPR